MAASARPVCRLALTHLQNIRINRNRCYLVNQTRPLSCSGIHCAKTPQRNSPVSSKVDFVTEAKPGLMARMENKLETNYPRVHKVYVLIKQGVIDFYADTKTLYSVSTEVRKGKKTSECSYHELDVYRQMPRDLLRVGPIVVLLNLPITDVLMPIFVIMFPRHLLSRHFWTAEQQSQFGEHYLRAQLPHFPQVMRSMDAQCQQVTDSGYRKLLNDIIFKLEQKEMIGVEEILEVQPMFRDDKPFGMGALGSEHRRHLAGGLGLSAWRSRAGRQALLLHHTDLALDREGVPSLSALQLKQACFLRGLNAAGCSDDEAGEYLQSWTRISRHVDDTTLSLLMHSPVLLAMNHPANANLRN